MTRENPDVGSDSPPESSELGASLSEAMSEVKQQIDEVLDWATSPSKMDERPEGMESDLVEFDDTADHPEILDWSEWSDADSPQLQTDVLLEEQPQDNTDWNFTEVAPLESEQMQEVGNPEALSPFWRHQGDTMDCALYAQGGILEAMGQEFDIEKYRQEGQEDGWYVPGEGTYLQNIGDLLENHGVPVNRYEGATSDDLVNEVAQGHGVVAAIDTEPLWGEPGGHAVWVTGVELGPDGKPASVICNDSGRPDGQKIAYPYDSFMEAWSRTNYTMVATREPLNVSN